MNQADAAPSKKELNEEMSAREAKQRTKAKTKEEREEKFIRGDAPSAALPWEWIEEEPPGD
jgi:hypothetical protein